MEILKKFFWPDNETEEDQEQMVLLILIATACLFATGEQLTGFQIFSLFVLIISCSIIFINCILINFLKRLAEKLENIAGQANH